MKAIKFPEVNSMLSEDQSQYETVPCHITKKGILVACFELEDFEVENIIKNKKIWLHVYKGNQPLQPFNIFALKNYFDSVVVDGLKSHVIDDDFADNEIKNLLKNDSDGEDKKT